jgi:hypothetical protein
MTTKIAEMSKEEFSELMESIIEKKLLEIIERFDEDSYMLDEIRERLLTQKELVAKGERGEDFDEVVKSLGLE